MRPLLVAMLCFVELAVADNFDGRVQDTSRISSNRAVTLEYG